MVSHCSQHSLQQSACSIRAKVQSSQSPIGSMEKAVVYNASDPGSSPLLSKRVFFSLEFPFQVKTRDALGAQTSLTRVRYMDLVRHHWISS